MVTLKVQSLNDIIEAYCKSLGYDGRDLKKVVKIINERFGSRLNPDDVIASLDAMLLGNIKNYLPATKLDNAQKVAMFKVVFLLNNGAKKWGEVIFEDKELPKELVVAIVNHRLEVVPEYKVSHMLPQKIEATNPLNIFHKIGNFFHKG